MRWLPGSLVPPNTSGGGEYFLNERWVARGLVLVVIGDKWITPSGTRLMTPVNNPGRTVGPQGRSTGYGTTDAGNANARMDSPFRLRHSTTGYRSYFGTCLARSTGLSGNSFGRIFQDLDGFGTDIAGNEAIYFLNGSIALTKVSNLASSVRQARPTAATPLGVWSSYGFSARFITGAACAAGDILCYQNGRSAAVTDTVPGQQYLAPSSQTITFGNRFVDSARCWDGQHGILAVFDSFLTDSEHQSLHANPNQLLVSSDRGIWAPAVPTVVIYRPGTDITTTDWTAVPGPGFYTAIDEDVASNTDYIQSPNRATPDDRPFEAGLSSTMPAGTWNVSIRTERLAGIMGVRVELMDGTTVTGTAQTNITLTGAQDYVIPVTTTANSTKVRIKVYDGGLP